MNPNELNNATPPSPAGWPTQGVRTTVSMLLFLHLAALAIGVMCNAMPLSALRNKLGDVPVRAYLAMLHMDLAYNFELTPQFEQDQNDPYRLDLYVEDVQLELDFAGQTNPAARQIVLPSADVWPGIRRQRYQNLAHVVSAGIGDEHIESILPIAVAGAMLAGEGITEGTHRLRCRRRFLVERHDSHSLDPANSDPDHPSRRTNVYEANVILDAGTLSFAKAVAAGEAAPVRKEP